MLRKEARIFETLSMEICTLLGRKEWKEVFKVSREEKDEGEK
jgi:hypothetical protein